MLVIWYKVIRNISGSLIAKTKITNGKAEAYEKINYTFDSCNVLGRASMRASGGNYHSSGLRGTGGQSRIFEEGANV